MAVATSRSVPPSTTAVIECGGFPKPSVEPVGFSSTLYRVTPDVAAMPAIVPASIVRDGNATDRDWRARNCESDSTDCPGIGIAGLLTEVQPAVGVAIIWRSPIFAVTLPGVWQVAVTVMLPALGMITCGGRDHWNP